MYVYLQSEPGLFTVGYYDPKGTWHPDSDHNDRDKAADRVAHLNGGVPLERFNTLEKTLNALREAFENEEGPSIAETIAAQHDARLYQR